VTSPDVLTELHTCRWDDPLEGEVGARTEAALESGQILYFSELAFALSAEERPLLSDTTSDGQSENVVFDVRSGRVHGTLLAGAARGRLQALMHRFALSAAGLVRALLPDYAASLEIARTSFRPVRVEGRRTSSRKDDTLLHIDAFASSPNQGRRILRVFSNVNPRGEPRRWEVGEPFESFAPRFASRIRVPGALRGWVLEVLHVTRGRRTKYDHVMLRLHDRAQADAHYQRAAPRATVSFPAQTTWMTFSDRVLHAALAGQHALEQTFLVSRDALRHPERSPLGILELLYQRPLV
jgi:hypothetical protein